MCRARVGAYQLMRHVIFATGGTQAQAVLASKLAPLDGERFPTLAEFEATWVRCDLKGAIIFHPK